VSVIATDDAPVMMTDEDKSKLERWTQMQEQHGIVSQLSVSNSLSTASSEITMTSTATTSTAAGGAGALLLCSSDSRLADTCLPDMDLTWSPSISLSSADIASCLQASGDLTRTAAEADVGDDGRTSRDTQQRCCAGYGVVDELTVPSLSNKYVV